jgi:UDP-N-acetyl-D-glucosamine dehydrogenase
MPGPNGAVGTTHPTVGVVGLGYVGLPLAAALAEAGREVVGLDVSADRVAELNAGISPVEDVPSERLAAFGDRFRATTDPAELTVCGAILVCVPTPLTNQREPDLAYVTAAAGQIAGALVPGQTIVLESTTYPGTTRDVFLPILEESGLRLGTDFHLAYSPERIDPGRSDHTVRTTPKVVGGMTPACTEKAADVYRAICDEVVVVSSPEAAELTKLFENIFRSVNIALVNELAQLTERLGIDVWEVIDAASTKPFGFMRFEPGPGMGGHCLPIDPFYLAFKAREYDFYTEFVELAGKINQAQPGWCVDRICEALNWRDVVPSRASVLVVGVAYKAGIGDLRESPGVKIIRKLRDRGVDASYHDPFVPELDGLGLHSVELDPETVGSVDAVCIVTAHDEVDYEGLVRDARTVIDLRGRTRRLDTADGDVVVIGAGAGNGQADPEQGPRRSEAPTR